MKRSTKGLPGERLAKLRNSKRLTQRELADKSGVSWQTICSIESGKNPGTQFENRELLAKALNVRRRDIWPDDDAGPVELPKGRELLKTEHLRR